jgi:hypothetical protein
MEPQILTRDQFVDAISKGLGRAMMYVKHHGLTNISDIVIDACLHNKVYDVQCEDSRSDWLYAMFSGSTQYDEFRNAILSALKQENECADILQLCDLAKEMALDGDEYARISLRDFVLKMASVRGETDHYGVEELINVEGDEAVLELAKIYGQRLIENPEDAVLARLSDEDEQLKHFAELLKEHSYSDSRIKMYFEYLDDNGGLDPIQDSNKGDLAKILEKRKREFLSEFNVDKIIQYAKDDVDKYRSRYRSFGLYAEPEDLKLILTELLQAKENYVRKNLLWIFRRRPLPVIHDCFFAWADSDDEDLRAAVLSALASSKDDRVHEFARQRVKDGKILGWGNSFVLDIFEKNFDQGDAKLITDTILASQPDVEDKHSLGLNVNGIAKKNECPELKKILLWVYENTPCSNCRQSAVKNLNEIGALSREMIEECTWDGSADIREFANSLIKKT